MNVARLRAGALALALAAATAAAAPAPSASGAAATPGPAAASGATVASGAAAASGSAALHGDAARGERIYDRCQACHALAYDRTGPRHCGLFGRKAGSVPGSMTFRSNPTLLTCSGRVSSKYWKGVTRKASSPGTRRLTCPPT